MSTELTTQKRPLTAVEQRKLDESREIKLMVSDRVARIQAMMPDLEPWLRQSKIDPGAFLAAFRLAMAKNPNIARCTPASLLLGCMDVARLGLQPDGKKAALVPFKNRDNGGQLEATVIVMYQGHLDIIYRTGLISGVTCQVVYEGEEDFVHLDLGQNKIEFNPPINRDETKKIVAAFATAIAKDGVGRWLEVVGEKGLNKIAATSKATSGPNKDWPGEMARKAPLRRMAKFLPTHPALEMLSSIEARAYQSLPREQPKISDHDLLSDEPTGAQIEGPAEEQEPDEDLENSSAGAVLRFCAMLDQADEPDVLNSRAELIADDDLYKALDAAEKAIVDMTLRQRREAFGLDGETGEPAVVE